MFFILGVKETSKLELCLNVVSRRGRERERDVRRIECASSVKEKREKKAGERKHIHT